MIWKFISIGMFLWLLESVLHLSGGLIALLGIVAVMALVTKTLVTARRQAEIRRLVSGLEN